MSTKEPGGKIMSVYEQTKSKANRVFISYSSIDRVRTKGLGLLLESMGHQVFHDHRTIKPGMPWEAALQDGLDQADAVMVFWTKHAASSDWVRKEYEYFQTTFPDRLLVPVLGDETPLPDILKTRQQADFAPIVNEMLETKRRMKREGASSSEIQSAVMSRLNEAGVPIKSKRQRMRIFLLLGFGWFLTLLRYPGALARQMGGGVVEKSAQLSLGHVAVLGLVGTVGFAGGKILPTQAELPEWADTVNDSVSVMGGNVRSLRSSILASQDDMSGKIARVTDSIIEIDRRITTITESRDEVVRHLVTILDEVRDTDSVAAVLNVCRAASADQRSTITELQATIAAFPTIDEQLGDTSVVVAPPTSVPNLVFERPEGEGTFVDPEPLFAPMPGMPQRARQQGIEGDVQVTAHIDENGNVTVEGVDGPGILRQAARDAVAEWQFVPGTHDGVPMQWRMNVPVRFSYGIDFQPPPGVGALIQPKAITAPYPTYPQRALVRRIEGTVMVNAVVQTDGSVLVQQVTGEYEILTAAAKDTIEGWRFSPGTRDGQAVAWEFSVPVTFRLRS